MDKKKGLANVATSLIFRVLLLIGSLLVRRYLIKLVGNELNGLDSLYTSLIGLLSVAELGIGVAITYCMYKPIINKDTDKVVALYCLFKKIYLIIGGIIAIGGMVIMPFLPYIAKDYALVDVNLYLTFALMLISVVLTYAFSADISLINAYKNNYIATIINSGGQLLQYILQIAVLFLTRSFSFYLLARIFAVIIQWFVTKLITHKQYNSIVTQKNKIDADTKKEVIKNTKAMFMHKIGGTLVNTADSIIISAFIGVIILGKYTNYSIIVTAMSGTIALFFTPLTSVIGHMCVEEKKESIQKYYNFFFMFNFIIGCIFFLGYYAVIDNIVSLCFGANLILAKSISFVITTNYFIQFMRQATLLFRDATGTFYNDRWKPLIEGIVNIILSICFVYLFRFLFGDNFAVVGVIAATIVTNLLICHIVEPYVLYKNAFESSVKRQYFKIYGCIAIFIISLIALHFCMVSLDNQWIELLANGGISLGFSLGVSAIVILFNKNFRQYAATLFGRLKHRSKTSIETAEENGSAVALESQQENEQTDPINPHSDS